MRGNLNGLLTRAASLRNLGVGSGSGVSDTTNKRGGGGGGLLTRAASLRNVRREGASDLLGSKRSSSSMHHVLETTDDETVFTSTEDKGKDQAETRQTKGAKAELQQQTAQSSSSSLNWKDHADDDDEASLTSEIFQLPQATNGKDRLGDNKWGSSYSQLSFTNLHHHSLPVIQCDINNPSNNSMILESDVCYIEKEEEKEISIHLGKKKQKKHQENDDALAIEKTGQPVVLADVSVDSVANLVEKKEDETKSTATTLKRQRKQATAPPRNRPSLRRRNSTSDMGTTIRGPSSSSSFASSSRAIINKPKSCSFESMNNTSSKRSPTRLKPSEGLSSKTEARRVRTTLRRGSLTGFAHDDSKRKNEKSKSIIASSTTVLHNDGKLEKGTTMPRLVTHQSMRDLSGFTTRDDTTKTSSSSSSSRPRLMGRGSRSDRRLTTRTGSERRLDMDRMSSRRKLMTMRLEMCG